LKTIKVARYRNVPYTVNYILNGSMKTYTWSGSKGNKYEVKEIPQEVVDWLVMNSQCFNDGELVIVEDSEEEKEIVDTIIEKEQYKNNTHSKEEIIKILNSSFNTMKSKLEKITVNEEKRFVVDVAKEIKLDSAQKQKYLADWIGVPVDILFGDDEEE